MLLTSETGEGIARLLPPEHHLAAVLPPSTDLARVFDQEPDLLILDLRTGPEPACAAMRALRNDPRTYALPMIALCDNEQICLRSLSDGANDYVAEPLQLPDLHAKIRAQLTLARSQRAALERERTLREEAEALNEVALSLTRQLDLECLLQQVTDAATRITGASYGAFFHNTVDAEGGVSMLYSLSGIDRALFERYGLPQTTELFAPTFAQGQVVRLDDLRTDPRYGRSAPHYGMPPGHPPVRSYMGVPVRAGDGRILGALLFGHPEAGIFTERAERLARGIAAQAAVAVDNARLYGEALRTQAALRETERRFRLLADHSPVIIWLSDRENACTYMSQGWQELTGQPVEEALGSGWLQIVHPDDRAKLLEIRQLSTGRRFRVEFRAMRRDGSYRWAYVVANPRVSEEGQFLGFVGSIVDITEEKEISNRLREADQRKNEFLAMLAHELRNPLAPISNSLELMQLSGNSPVVVEHAQQIMARQVRHMVRLIDDLLDLSRITRGKIELRCEPTELRVIIENAVEACRPLIERYEHHLGIDIPERPIQVEADLTRLSQVFTNLLNNAAQYTPRGGRIEIRAREEDGQAVVIIRDTGMGIPKDKLEKIFDMFVQLDRSLENPHGGLGIGLTLVHRIVQLHQGSVHARSGGPGKGSEFVVTLPLLDPARPRDARPQDNCGTTTATGRRVLVAEDPEDTGHSVAAILEWLGAEVRTAQTEAEVIYLADEFHPELVVLDLGLGQVDAAAVSRTLRRGDWARDLAIVALQAGRPEREAQDGGEFEAYLTKPVDLPTIHAMLRELLTRTARTEPA